MASRPFQIWEKKRSKIRKRAAKHFKGLAALSTHSAGRRAAVKAGCEPVHFSLDGCPLSCYLSGRVATTLGHFVHKSERRTRDGGVHIPAAVLWKQPDFLLIPIRKNSARFPAGANGAHKAPPPVSPVSHASRYNTLHFASQSRVPNGGFAPFGNPHKKRQYATPPRGAYRLFLLSSPPAVSVEQKSAWDLCGIFNFEIPRFLTMKQPVSYCETECFLPWNKLFLAVKLIVSYVKINLKQSCVYSISFCNTEKTFTNQEMALIWYNAFNIL